MLYAMSLRAIGHALEMLRLQTFSLEKKGETYIVRSDSLTPTHQWILRSSLTGNLSHAAPPEPTSMELAIENGSLCFGPLDIARLHARIPETRSTHGSDRPRDMHSVAQLLHALGEYLDSKEAAVVRIAWAPDSASVEYQTPDGVFERRNFSLEKLHQLALHSKLRRSSRNGLIASR
jgi:hypothetical protein